MTSSKKRENPHVWYINPTCGNPFHLEIASNPENQYVGYDMYILYYKYIPYHLYVHIALYYIYTLYLITVDSILSHIYHKSFFVSPLEPFEAPRRQTVLRFAGPPPSSQGQRKQCLSDCSSK